MKVIKRIFLCFYVLFSIALLLIGVSVGFYQNSIANVYKITVGNEFKVNTLIPVTAEHKGEKLENCNELSVVGKSIKVDFKLLGVIPIKQTTVEVVSESYVAVLGTPFGIRLYTDGVLVTNIEGVEGQNGKENPALKAGIKEGDYIISVDGKKVFTNEDIADIVTDSGGKTLEIILKRKGKEIKVKLTPVLSKEDCLYRAGIWVKDSAAGLGTLTFYCPYNNMICGLGHAIFDNDTGEIINYSKGDLVSAEIYSVVKGTKGVAGSLKGKMTYSSLGKVEGNLSNGVYGQATCQVDTKNLTPVCYKQDVKDGAANVVCTVDGTAPVSYSCQIRLNKRKNSGEQDFNIIITDSRLIEKTGGIVQGMSGSPIIQNGKLIGAVTHVLIDEPTKGYGIFAENMLETAQSVAESNNLKEAS